MLAKTSVCPLRYQDSKNFIAEMGDSELEDLLNITSRSIK